MTIKQQGVVFGRNPTFNDVTVEGDLSISGTLSNANTAKLDANQTFTGSNNFTENVYIQNSSFPPFSLYNAIGERVKLYYDTNTAAAVLGTTVTAPVKFYVNNGEVASFTTSGNLAFPSGKGIDFSATAGTGTSELFDDYEEGTWTPNDASGAGLTLTGVVGNYTKIGNTVFASGFVTYPTTADGSAAKIGGLPFTSANNNAQSLAAPTYKQNTNVGTMKNDPNTTNLRLYTETGSSTTNANMSGNVLYFGCVYHT